MITGDVAFDFHGVTVRVSSPSAELLEDVRRDFSYFSVGEIEGKIKLFLEPSAPPYESLPPLPASFYTPRNVCFSDGDVNYIDYFGKGLSVYDRKKEECTVYGLDHHLVHEIAYLYILSTVNQRLERRGIHRLHSLGVSYRGSGILLILPSGGGKSTMALKLLGLPDFRLLAEDTPLIDRRGYVLPFPLRLGIRPGEESSIPAEYLRTVERMEFDPKMVIDIEAFREKIGGRVKPDILLVGERNSGDVSGITPCSYLQTSKALVKNMVVGLGVYQGLEFLLERSIWEILGKCGTVASRSLNSLRLMSGAKAYRFVLGRNMDRNCEELLRFLERRGD